MCIARYKKLKRNDQLDVKKLNFEALDKHVENLEKIFESVTSTYIQNDAQYVYSVYKKQTEPKLKTISIKSASSIRILHQLQLGTMDALIEHSFFNQSYR
jgi:hypothetical protein